MRKFYTSFYTCSLQVTVQRAALCYYYDQKWVKIKRAIVWQWIQAPFREEHVSSHTSTKEALTKISYYVFHLHSFILSSQCVCLPRQAPGIKMFCFFKLKSTFNRNLIVIAMVVHFIRVEIRHRHVKINIKNGSGT